MSARMQELSGAAALAGLALCGGEAPVLAMSTGSWLALVVSLLVLGFAFLGAELFVIPGFGVAGVVGIASLVAGVSIAWVKFGTMWGVVLLGGSLLATLAALMVLFKTGAGRRLTLETSLAGTSAVATEQGERLLGAEGVAVTMLRPSGSAEFGDERVEVETDGEFLPKGTRVRVVAVRLGRVVVEAAPAGAAPGGGSAAA